MEFTYQDIWTDLGGITDHLTGKGGDWKDIITTTTTTQDITLNFKAGTASNEEVCKPWNWSSRSLNLRAIQRQNIHNKLQPLIKKTLLNHKFYSQSVECASFNIALAKASRRYSSSR